MKTIEERRDQFKSRWECDLGKADNYKEEGAIPAREVEENFFPNHTLISLPHFDRSNTAERKKIKEMPPFS